MTARPRYRVIDTFSGPFALIVHPDGSLATTWLEEDGGGLPAGAVLDRRLETDLARRIRDYFAGREVSFSDVPLPKPGTFHHRCWRACRRIRLGRTMSYGQLAAAAGGSAGAARAAGQAMRRNPLPVIVPCHRVVAADGSLHGFSGSVDPDGPHLDRKQRLLAHEARLAPPVGAN